jgi:hypothetical protein
MRIGNPGTFVCKGKGSDRGMHHWRRMPGWDEEPRAQCIRCELVLDGEDAQDVFRGAETPIGQIKRAW